MADQALERPILS